MADILARIKSTYKRDSEAWSDCYQKARDDLYFLSDDKHAQWDSKDYNNRIKTGRPALTIDQLSQFIHQVANDIRMNTPAINIIPSDSEASDETAEILKGLIRNIEYVSGADDAYDTASLNSIKSSIGFIRVDHDYVNEQDFEQQLLIKRVTNPLSVVIDSDAVEPDGSDAKHATIIDTMLVSDFKKKYPDKEIACFEDENKVGNKIKDDTYITIAEHFKLDDEISEIGLTITGETAQVTEGFEYKATRKVKKRVIRRYILSGAEILEQTTFPGKYIPIVPVYGEEAWVDGKRNLYSLIRKSKDAQRMFNYWKSLETELLMKQPNAPFLAAEGTVEDYSEDYINANKAVVLRYKQTDAENNPAPPPQRLAPPTVPVGIVEAARAAVDDIKATMGLYNASLGQRSNETSGVAIQRRMQEGDVATFHFGDNLVRSITHVGRILVCAIPEIYDTARIIRIIGVEDKSEMVGINGQIVENQKQSYDLTNGIYDARVTTGASYTTKRQEAAALINDIISRDPTFMQVAGDLLFENLDAAGAPVIAERMRKVIAKTNPDLLEDDDNDPVKIQLQAQLQQAAQQIQQLQTQMQQMAEDAQTEINTLQQEIDNKQAEIDNKQAEIVIKGKSEQEKNQTEQAKIILEEQKIQKDYELKMVALQLKARELDIKAAEAASKNLATQQSMDMASMEDCQDMQCMQEELGEPNS